jgi:PAS domain S-box-containing protein
LQSRLLKAALWLVLLGLLAWFVLRTVVRPMRAFQDTIDRLRANPNDEPSIPKDQPGELGHLANSFIDLMGDLRRSRNELALSIDKLRRTAKAFANMKEGVLITDPEGRIVSSNPAFTRQSGYEPDELAGQTTALFRSDRHDAAFFAEMWQQLQQSGQWSGTIWNRAKDGSVRPQWVSLLASRDADGRVRCYVGLYSEVEDV